MKRFIKTLGKPRLSIKDQTFFAKRLAYLVKGGVPLLDSLNIIRRGTKSKSQQRILDSLVHDVSRGQYLSTSMVKFKDSFGNFAINIIKIGEMSGILHHNLVYLAEELMKKHLLRKKIISALIYPILITVATLSIVIFLTLYTFPKITPIFQSLGANLPFTTKALIWISAFLGSYGIYLLIGFVALIVGFIFAHATFIGFKYFVNKMMIIMPVTGKITKSYNVANTCRTMGILLKSDINIIEAVRMTAETTVNEVYKRELMRIAEGVKKGEKLANFLAERPDIFPDIVPEMVAIGETTGNLPDTLLYLAELYEGEVEDHTKNLSTAIEPVLMVVMGVLVGFVAVSVIAPIYELTQSIPTGRR